MPTPPTRSASSNSWSRASLVIDPKLSGCNAYPPVALSMSNSSVTLPRSTMRRTMYKSCCISLAVAALGSTHRSHIYRSANARRANSEADRTALSFSREWSFSSGIGSFEMERVISSGGRQWRWRSNIGVGSPRLCVERFDRQVDGKRAEVVIAEPSPPVLVTVLFARAFPEQVAGPKQHEAVPRELLQAGGDVVRCLKTIKLEPK